MNPDLRVSSVQCGLFSSEHSSFTPESCRLLLLRSSSLRLEDWELRTEDRAAQLLSERLQPLSLKKNQQNKRKQLQTLVFFLEQIINHINLDGSVFTYRALLEALTTGSSLRRASSEAEYFFRSNTSRSSSDDSKMKTRADH